MKCKPSFAEIFDLHGPPARHLKLERKRDSQVIILINNYFILGHDPPSLIDNTHFYDENLQIKQGLSSVKDYLAVKPKVWTYWWQMYPHKYHKGRTGCRENSSKLLLPKWRKSKIDQN